jgi:hypothetical protein
MLDKLLHKGPKSSEAYMNEAATFASWDAKMEH